MSKTINFGVIRRRNQALSFTVFSILLILLVLSLFNNPWYKIPLEWYFIPVLGLAGGIIAPLFFGRHYCGQYCPMGFIADGINPVNKAGRLLKSKKLRILFLILFIGLFVVAFLPWNMGLPASMTRTYWEATMNKLWILWVICPFGIALPLMLVWGLPEAAGHGAPIFAPGARSATHCPKASWRSPRIARIARPA